MGYFSQFAIEQASCRDPQPDHSYMTPEIALELELDDLRAKLTLLCENRPGLRESMEYDRWFYADREESVSPEPVSMQGLQYAIRNVERMAKEIQNRRFRELCQRISVFNTGADEYGQLVIVELFRLAAMAVVTKQERRLP